MPRSLKATSQLDCRVWGNFKAVFIWQLIQWFFRSVNIIACKGFKSIYFRLSSVIVEVKNDIRNPKLVRGESHVLLSHLLLLLFSFFVLYYPCGFKAPTGSRFLPFLVTSYPSTFYQWTQMCYMSMNYMESICLNFYELLSYTKIKLWGNFEGLFSLFQGSSEMYPSLVFANCC